MKARLQKWSKDLAILIPQAIADEANLRQGSLVELSLHDGQILVRPLYDYSLDNLLTQITDETKYREIDMGKAQGKEFW